MSTMYSIALFFGICTIISCVIVFFSTRHHKYSVEKAKDTALRLHGKEMILVRKIIFPDNSIEIGLKEKETNSMFGLVYHQHHPEHELVSILPENTPLVLMKKDISDWCGTDILSSYVSLYPIDTAISV